MLNFNIDLNWMFVIVLTKLPRAHFIVNFRRQCYIVLTFQQLEHTPDLKTSADATESPRPLFSN